MPMGWRWGTRISFGGGMAGMRSGIRADREGNGKRLQHIVAERARIPVQQRAITNRNSAEFRYIGSKMLAFADRSQRATNRSRSRKSRNGGPCPKQTRRGFN